MYFPMELPWKLCAQVLCLAPYEEFRLKGDANLNFLIYSVEHFKQMKTRLNMLELCGLSPELNYSLNCKI